MSKISKITSTFDTGLEVTITNENTILALHTPLVITVMYNTSDTAGSPDRSFSVSPAGLMPITYSNHDEYQSTPHKHDFFELLIVLKGKIYQNIEGCNYLYSAGSCCLINRNIFHSEKFLGEGTILFIQFSTDFLKSLIDESRSDFFSETRKITNDLFKFIEENMISNHQKSYLDIFPVYQMQYEYAGNESIYIHGSKNTFQLHRIANEMVRHLFMPRLGSEHVIKGLLYELFDYLNSKENFHTIPVDLKTKSEDLLFSRITFLLEGNHGRLSRSQLEQALHYSGNYLNSIVKQHTGLSLFDYGSKITMQEAAKLLIETNHSIGTIIEELHFSNWGHFNQLFKKQYGMLPKAYRSLHKNKTDL